MPDSALAFFRACGARGGAAGRGECKRRTPEQCRAAGLAGVAARAEAEARKREKLALLETMLAAAPVKQRAPRAPRVKVAKPTPAESPARFNPLEA